MPCIFRRIMSYWKLKIRVKTKRHHCENHYETAIFRFISKPYSDRTFSTNVLGGKKKSLGRGGGFPVEILRQRNTIFSRGMHQNMRSDVSVLLFLQDDAVVKNNSIFVHVPLHTVLVHEARGEGEGGGEKWRFPKQFRTNLLTSVFRKVIKTIFKWRMSDSLKVPTCCRYKVGYPWF